MRTILALILLTAGLAGCGAEGDEPRQPEPVDDGLVLKVEAVPAGPPPHRVPAQLMVALYADGRVLLPAPQILIFPGPVLPGFNEARLSADEVERVLARLEQAGALTEKTALEEQAREVPTRVVTAVVDGERRTIRLPEGSQQANALDRVVADLPFGNDRPYEPQGLAIFASSAGEPVETTRSREIRPEPVIADWPGDPLQTGCDVVTAGALKHVLAAARKAHELTFWRSEGSIYRVLFRPLVPGETSCADLAS